MSLTYAKFESNKKPDGSFYTKEKINEMLERTAFQNAVESRDYVTLKNYTVKRLPEYLILECLQKEDDPLNLDITDELFTKAIQAKAPIDKIKTFYDKLGKSVLTTENFDKAVRSKQKETIEFLISVGCPASESVFEYTCDFEIIKILFCAGYIKMSEKVVEHIIHLDSVEAVKFFDIKLETKHLITAFKYDYLNLVVYMLSNGICSVSPEEIENVKNWKFDRW